MEDFMKTKTFIGSVGLAAAAGIAVTCVLLPIDKRAMKHSKTGRAWRKMTKKIEDITD